MRVLLVEDEEAVVKEIIGLLESRCAADVSVARSRDAALSLINDEEDYDLIVCDLRIPTSDGGLDVSEDHGFRVHDAARKRHSGTPCIFFSGFVNLENVGQRLATAPSVDLFGTGKLWPLVDVRPKHEQPEFIERAAELAAALGDIDAMELDLSESGPLSNHEARPLRLYARRLGGTRVAVSTLGGLSGAKVFRVEIFDASQSSVGWVVAKVDVISKVVDEIARYSKHVAPALGIGAFAPLAGEVLHASGRFGAAFYTLAVDGHNDLFDLVTARPSEAAAAVVRLKDGLSAWGRGQAQSVVSIGDLRSARVSDERLASFTDKLDKIGRRRVEAVRLDVTMAVQHGDLHGRNVLVDAEGRPLIIDYGDVGLGPAVLDPVTLELSLLLHDEHPDLSGWPTREQAKNWFNLDHYVRDSPVRDVVLACREWATSAGTDLELAAMVYAHAVRQLKYPDTDKGLALTLAEAAAVAVLASGESNPDISESIELDG